MLSRIQVCGCAPILGRHYQTSLLLSHAINTQWRRNTNSPILRLTIAALCYWLCNTSKIPWTRKMRSSPWEFTTLWDHYPPVIDKLCEYLAISSMADLAVFSRLGLGMEHGEYIRKRCVVFALFFLVYRLLSSYASTLLSQ